MDAQISQCLQTLAPTVMISPPPELIRLAKSLLAQSRTRASSIDPKAEIARPYACAHIACERLKDRLSLPKIEPRPPCPPRLYKQLYSSLSTLLAEDLPIRHNASRPRESPLNERRLKAPEKVSEPVRVSAAATPSKQSRSSSSLHREKASTDPRVLLPPWVPAVIRRVCREIDCPNAVPHVNAGVEAVSTVLANVAAEGQGQSLSMNLSALIIALSLYVRGRLTGVGLVRIELQRQAAATLSLMGRLRKEIPGMMAVAAEDIEKHLIHVSRNGWTKLEWFENVPFGAGLGAEKDEKEAGDEGSRIHPRSWTRHEDTSHNSDCLRPGLGTMMRDVVDFTNDEKRRQFSAWKLDFMHRAQRDNANHAI